SLGGVIDGFGAQARSVAGLLREDTTAFAIVTSPEPEPAREAVFLAEYLASAGMARGALIVNRVNAYGLDGHRRASAAKLLEPELGPRLAARVAANLADFDVLARRDAATVQTLARSLEEDAPAQIPQLDADVQDLGGLARVARHLLD